MTVQAATHHSVVLLSTQHIGNAFVMQYYHILCNFPELVYKFYNDTSVLSRPNSDDMMTSVTTMKDIDAKIQSLNFKNSTPEIETVDAQDSYYKGIIVVVTGSLGGTNDVKRKFTQTFFLAPQEKGYFVLNDVFRYVKESEQLEISSEPFNCDSDSAPIAPLASISDTEETEALKSGGEVCNPLDNQKHSDMVEEIVNERPTHSGQDGTMTVISSDSSEAQQDNRSYASIVKVPKSAATAASNLRWAPTRTSPKAHGSTNLSSEPTASPQSSDIAPQSSNPQEVEGHSIYIRNLPLNTTVAHVIEEFTKFGPISHGGVQIKIHKEYGYRYGFVEFQSLDSMQNAIKKSPLTIGGHRVVVEEKKSTIKVGSIGFTERFISGRGKFQNSFRGRGYFDGRNELINNRKFSRRPKSSSGRYSEYRYQRVERSGAGEHGTHPGVDESGLLGCSVSDL